MHKQFHEENRIAWNEATRAHNSHKADQALFLREGGTTLFPEEVALLGDLHGRTLLHLQCNAGQDTLSLARLGATVTGVDISDEAITFAKQLARDSGIPGTFYRADIYDWLAQAAKQVQQFDRVFSSYGAIAWLSDIRTWAKGISQVLAPGGQFVLVEFHPVINMLNEEWQIVYSYGGGKHEAFEVGIGDYVAWAGPALAPSGYLEGVKDFQNPHRSHEFAWGIADVVGALLAAGLQLEALEEYPYSNGAAALTGTVAQPGNRYGVPAGRPQIPFMYGLRVKKEASS